MIEQVEPTGPLGRHVDEASVDQGSVDFAAVRLGPGSVPARPRLGSGSVPVRFWLGPGSAPVVATAKFLCVYGVLKAAWGVSGL